jgi:RNA polymerase sigma-70 factor, ECF subfamily
MSATMTSIVADEIGEEVAENVTLLDPGTEDAALVAAAKRGDGQAFEVLVGRHQSRIRAIASRFTRLPEDAEDIAQQSFQKAFLHLRQFEGNSSFSTWLTRIAINEALMWLRRKRTSREVPMEESGAEDGQMLPLDSPDPGPSPEDSYLQREWKQILSRAMNHLTPAIRSAIELRDLGERSTDETAGIMRVSTGAVKARLFHGRRKLRVLLKRYVESAGSQGSQAMRRSGKVKRIARQQLVPSPCD